MYAYIYFNYVNGMLMFILSLCVNIALMLLTFVLSIKKKINKKRTAYECGFDTYQILKLNFDVHFYVVALLFLIFDLEIIFLYPWSIMQEFISYEGFMSMYFFLILIVLGYIYEWKKGGLNWVWKP